MGRWLQNQKQAYNGKGTYKIAKEQIKLLEEIGMDFNVKDNKKAWMDKYNLAKKYYEHYGNLRIPQNFKTINGIDYDENGVALGKWLQHQKQAYIGKGSSKITEEQIRLLEEIGMDFNIKDNKEVWMDKYNLAKKYYEHYGNLQIAFHFKTTNGIDYDEDGIALGIWLSRQKQAYTGKGTYKITEEQIKLLEEIGMDFNIKDNKEAWLTNYNLAKKYYEHYGNLKIAFHFKTINGIDYDEAGIALGRWIHNQKQAYNKQGHGKITEEQIRLLEEIGMDFNVKDNKETWMSNYNLVKKYYNHYGNLKMPQNFKTTNGINYDENGIALERWIRTQKQAYNGKGSSKITEEQIRLLEDIGIVWFTSKTDEKLQKEQINSNNIKRKEKEITNRVYSYLGKIDNNDNPTKEKINEGFIDELNKNFKR